MVTLDGVPAKDGVCRYMSREGRHQPTWSRCVQYEHGDFWERKGHKVFFATADFQMKTGVAGAVLRDTGANDLLFSQIQPPGGVAVLPRLLP